MDELNQQLDEKNAKKHQNKLQKCISNILEILEFSHNMTVTEQDQKWTNDVESYVLSDPMGVLLLKKIQPLIPLIIKKKRMRDPCKIVIIEPSSENEIELITNYLLCFQNFIESPYASFKTANNACLGNVNIRDYFVLQFLAMATCKRIRQDTCLQLGLSGKSSIGKTAIFEAPILSSSILFTAQQGVGRYVTDNKSIFLLNDIDIQKFICSTDGDMFKLITRTEPASAKIHGSTNTVESIHVFYTTNGRLFSHKFSQMTSNVPGNALYGSGRNFVSSMQAITVKNLKTKEEIEAFQNRFIECFCYAPPPLDLSSYIPKCRPFQKIHLVIGTFEYVLSILEKYEKKDFYSEALQTYCCAYLFEYLNYYETIFPEKYTVTKKRLEFVSKKLLSNDIWSKLEDKYIK